MMKTAMYKKIMLFAAIVVVAAAFAACGGAGQSQSAGGQSASENTAEGSAVQSSSQSQSVVAGQSQQSTHPHGQNREEEHGQEAVYFEVEGFEEYLYIMNARYNFGIVLPKSWRAVDYSTMCDGYTISCGTEGVDIRCWGQNYVEGAGQVNGLADEFYFDCGLTGWVEELEGETYYYYLSEGRVITFYVGYAGHEAWYEENHTVLEEAARTLHDLVVE